MMLVIEAIEYLKVNFLDVREFGILDLEIENILISKQEEFMQMKKAAQNKNKIKNKNNNGDSLSSSEEVVVKNEYEEDEEKRK